MEIKQAQTEIDLTQARYKPAAVRRLDALFLDHIARGKIQAAAYLLARGGRSFVHKAMGRLRYNDPAAEFEINSIRWIASITKLFTAVGILQLIEDGLLYLEQPVADIIKDFDTPQHRDINLFHLLTHTSGLPADSGYFLEPYPQDFPHVQEMAEAIRHHLSGPKQSEPGAAWSYSSMGFCILGQVIAHVAGMEYEQYVQQKIFTPLGMRDSFFEVPENLKHRVAIVNAYEEERFIGSKRERIFAAGGGILTTAYDLSLFGRMLLGKGSYNGVRVLGRKTVEAMTRNWLGSSTPAFCWGRAFRSWQYGLGIDISQGNIVSRGTLNHEGYGRCGMYLDPSEDFLAVYLVPSASEWDAETIENPRAVIWAGLE